MSPELERFLEPGQVVFAQAPESLRTLLGSCVAITFWHPRRKFGAMCHYLVPERSMQEKRPLDGTFASEAIELVRRRIQSLGLAPASFTVRMFGGGNMFPGLPVQEGPLIGERNAEAGRRLLEAAGFRIAAEDVGGEGQRVIVFELQSGSVQVRRGPRPCPAAPGEVPALLKGRMP